MNPVRVYLALLLAVQFFVPLVPSWGAFVPHDHWARTPISSEDWNVHFQEHLSGTVVTTAASTNSQESEIVVTLGHDGLTSSHAPLADHATDFEFAFTLRVILHNLVMHEFAARTIAYPPLKPPPTL